LVFKPLIDLEFSNSFPSGHASVFFALAMAVFLFNRRWSYYFFVGAVLNGLARVYVGVHWPTDILGGMVVGILSALIVWKVLPKPNQVNI
ncbi:MAG: phosphatase PAP2 family protein, partial [Patescibacteria group bacterium]